MSNNQHVRHGAGSARPYLYGGTDMLELVRQAFGAVELERQGARNNGFHVEARIGDSIIVMEACDALPGTRRRSQRFVCEYVVDSDLYRVIKFGWQNVPPVAQVSLALTLPDNGRWNWTRASSTFN